MRSHWSKHAVQRLSPLEQLVSRSQLIGQEESLGLYGGGNTSTKCRQPDLLGRPHLVLWVKGSGANLKGCQPKHFAPLRMEPLRELARKRTMSDEEMVAFLERCVLDPRAPRPSVETLLHALIPETDIDHTHADAILAIANTTHGERLARKVLGPGLLWIPYLQPGFALSKKVFEAYLENPSSHGAVLEKHGLITWGPDGRISYERTVQYVSKAERYLAAQRCRRVWSGARFRTLPPADRVGLLRNWLPAVRRTLSRLRPVCLTYTDTPDVLAFVNASKLPEISRIGPATPDHMLRTKRLPCILDPKRGPEAAVKQLERYAAAHERYYQRNRQNGHAMLDPYPRVILIPGVGMLTSGKDGTDADMVAHIYRHAMGIMRDASTVGGYTSVSEREAFGVEYWPLELYKLSLAPPEAELARKVGLVTGATGGIGRGIAEQLIDAGACVVVTDLKHDTVTALEQELNTRAGRRRALGVVMDVTQERSIERAFDAALRAFGGLDFLVSNAGVATVASVDRLKLVDWERSFAVNSTGHFLVARAMVRWLRAQRMGGGLVFISSKNVPAPGKDFAAYSAAKASETQLARVLAIENGEFGIRVNIVNPDGVFEGSGLWRTIGKDRAQTYKLHPSQLEAYYQQRNLLKTRVLPEDVAEAVGFLLSPRAAKTTGCILTVDGGLREAFPR